MKIFSLVSFICLSFTTLAYSYSEKIYEHSEGAPHLSLIRSARKSIEIEIYSMKNSRVLNALKQAVGRGVKLAIVQEDTPVGEACRIFTEPALDDEPKCLEMKKFISDVRQKGAKVVPFDSRLCGTAGEQCFQHGKMMIIDEKKVLISSGNFNTSSFCDDAENPPVCNRDFSIVTDDPVVVQASRKVFLNDLKGVRTQFGRVITPEVAKRLTFSPHSLKPLISFIDSAEKTLQVQTQYLKNAELNQALIRAAKRGVKVYLVVSSACAFGEPEDRDVRQWTKVYGEFDSVGIKTRAFSSSIKISGRPGYQHTKAMIADGVRAWIGSVNGSTMSLTQNREFGLFTENRGSISVLADYLYKDFVNKNTQTWQESLVCLKDKVK